MLRLLFYDLTRGFSRTERSLKRTARTAIVAVPPSLRADVGLSDARIADLVDGHVRSDRAASRAHDAHRLLAILNTIAESRGFPRLRWCVQAKS